jgi:hypothetical protein
VRPIVPTRSDSDAEPDGLLDRLHSADRDLDREVSVGRHGGPQLLAYRTEPDGCSELEFVIAAPGTRIAPEYSERCLMAWRVQSHPTLRWEAVTLAEVVAAVPAERDWVIASHERILVRLAKRTGSRRPALLERLEDELRVALPAPPEESIHVLRTMASSRSRQRRQCKVKVTAVRSRRRDARPLAHAAGDAQLRVGHELDDPIIVHLSGTEPGKDAEIEVDLKRSVITFWPRRGNVALDDEPLVAIRRIEVSRRSPEWDEPIDQLIERLADVV